MSKRLFIDGTFGAMFIAESTVPDVAISDPTPYLADLNFHSNLEYLRIIYSYSSASLSYSSMSPPSYAPTVDITTDIIATGVPSLSFLLIKYQNEYYPNGLSITYSGGHRTIQLGYDSALLQIEAISTSVANSSFLPADTVNFEVYGVNGNY